jgi:AraC-like DNA-binding protein
MDLLSVIRVDNTDLSATRIRQLEDTMARVPVVGLAAEVPTHTHVEPHTHERGQLMFCRAGVMVIDSCGSSWVAPPQRAVWIPRGVEHNFFPTTHIALRNLLMLPDVEAALPDQCCFVRVNPLLRELILRITESDERFRSPAHSDRVAQLVLDEIEPSDAPPLSLPEPQDPRIKRICAALKLNPADQRTLDDWSRTAGASCRTLARLFLRETGLSFSSWRRQARLVHASVRLGLGQSVTSVALEAGYESPSAFIEMFRRSMGQTPKQYFNLS